MQCDFRFLSLWLQKSQCDFISRYMALNFAFATLFLIVYLTFVILFLMHATLYLITRLHISQCDFRFRSCDIRNHNVFISRYVNLYLAVVIFFSQNRFSTQHYDFISCNWGFISHACHFLTLNMTSNLIMKLYFSYFCLF